MRIDLARLRRLRLFDPATEIKVPAGQSVYDPAVFGRYEVSARDDDGLWSIGFDELMVGAQDHARDFPSTIERDRYALVLPMLSPGRGTLLDACTASPEARVRDHIDRLGYDYQAIDIHGDGEGALREDVTALSFADESIARIISLDTLEHVEGYAQALTEFHRVLEPGGVLLVHVPIYFVDREHSAPLDPANDPWGHVRYFSARELMQEVTGAGFALLRAQLHLDYGAALCVAGKLPPAPVRA